MPTYETITVERRGKVAILTINRPDKLNALNKQVHTEGVDALDELRKDDSVRVLVITGAGEKSFIAGADISEFEGQTPVTQRDLFHEKTFFNSIDSFPKPVIAMVNGMGGTPLIELYLVFNELRLLLESQGIAIQRSLVGPYITSLEMAGTSITLLRLDDELIRLWDAPVRTAGLRWGA